MTGRPAKTKHTRERSPPLMQTLVTKKGKKSPHQKEDRRSKNDLYVTGKSSVASAGNSDDIPQRISPGNKIRKTSKTSIG